MKKLISIVLALVLVFSVAVPSFAVTADDLANKLYTGWGSGTTVTYPSGYSTSWYYRVIYWLDAINDNATSIKNALSSGGSIESVLYDIYINTGGTGSLYSMLNNNLKDVIEAIENNSGGSSDLANIESSLGEKTTENNSIIWCLNQLNARMSNTTGEFYKFDGDTQSATSDFFDSVGTNLYTFTYDFLKDYPYVNFNSVDDNGDVIGDISISKAGVMGALVSYLSQIGSSITAIRYSIADPDTLKFHKATEESKSNVLDLATTGVTSSSGSSLSMISGISDGIGLVTVFNEKFTSSDVSVGDVFKIFDDTSVSLAWFTEETASNIDGVVTTFSRDLNSDTEVVTSYYQENKKAFDKIWGDLVG